MLIKNLTASPYDLQGVDGPVRIPAFGEAEGEFTGEYLEILAASNAVEIVNDPAPKKAKADPKPEPKAAPAPETKAKSKAEAKTPAKDAV